MPRRNIKKQIISIISLPVFVFVCVISLWNNFAAVIERETILEGNTTYKILKYDNQKSEAFHGKKLVHVDLKGAPPLVSYLKDFFQYIRKLGATGVVIEYEDMFFYKDELEDIRALNAYQPSVIKAIQTFAKSNNLIVLPLIQIFGHLEFVLKLEKFKELREVSAYPQTLCPSHERSLTIIKKMIDQVLEAHPGATYIHIGCDEVLHFGECDKCKSVMIQNHWTKTKLFLNHVRNIAVYINKTYPGVRPIIWSDMIDKVGERVLKTFEISSLVDVMIWDYKPDLSDYLTNSLLGMYARVFKSVWIASAFKGATGVSQIITNPRKHLENHIAWMAVVSSWKDHINFKGIVITGWQRYDHFAQLCELLPMGIPSLTICLGVLNGSEKGLRESYLTKPLQCDTQFSFHSPNAEFLTEMRKCNFPGFRVYALIIKLYNVSKKITHSMHVVKNEWFTFYHVLHKFSSPLYVKRIFNNFRVEEELKKLTQLEEDLRKALSEVFDVFTVQEWITSYVLPLRIQLEAICSAKDAILSKSVWPRRPLLS